MWHQIISIGVSAMPAESEVPLVHGGVDSARLVRSFVNLTLVSELSVLQRHCGIDGTVIDARSHKDKHRNREKLSLSLRCVCGSVCEARVYEARSSNTSNSTRYSGSVLNYFTHHDMQDFLSSSRVPHTYKYTAPFREVPVTISI